MPGRPGINIKINSPEGFYNKVGIQRASNPDGPFAEKTANPSGLEWSTPNSGVLIINEVGYRDLAAPGQLATWVRAAQHKQLHRFQIRRAQYRELRSIRSGGSTVCSTGPSKWSGCKGLVRRRLGYVRAARTQSL